ncbi:expressed unknown protein [Seminavis robusta]|uniref:Uncharacterized protein n=1 Tax=Seminavis robusta TaxID=568900 RepID=A0A9N8HF65_9STRA|nr:expressed unknown protein [Seminavis robusta]|eukprot:Sro553_g165320.1 n/a (315) ;mRNA; r:29622-30566
MHWRRPDLPSQVRQVLDVKCIKAAAPAISSAQTLCVDTRFHWTVHALAELLCCLLQSEYLEELELTLPHSNLEEEGTFGYDMSNSLQPLFARAQIRKLEIRHHSILGNSLKFLNMLEDPSYGVAQMPKLEELMFELGGGQCLQQIFSMVCELLGRNKSTLRSLSLTHDAPHLDPTNAKGDLSPVLEALAQNMVLQKFEYCQNKPSGGYMYEPVDYPEREAYEAHVLKVLQTNMVLTDVSLRGRRRQPANDGVQYHCDLNQCGRKKVVDKSATLSDLVKSLTGDHWQYIDNESKTWPLGLVFGLLRASPALWRAQ